MWVCMYIFMPICMCVYTHLEGKNGKSHLPRDGAATFQRSDGSSIRHTDSKAEKYSSM